MPLQSLQGETTVGFPRERHHQMPETFLEGLMYVDAVLIRLLVEQHRIPGDAS